MAIVSACAAKHCHQNLRGRALSRGHILDLRRRSDGQSDWRVEIDRKIGSIREAVFAHSQGDNDTLRGPIEGDGAAKLGSHIPVHQLTSEALQLNGRQDRRAAPFGPHESA
jgi:hypothetical protein